MNNEITGTLENWQKDPVHNIYWGHIYGDVRRRFYDGCRIHTSYVEQGPDENNIIKTLNSTYKLGVPFNGNS